MTSTQLQHARAGAVTPAMKQVAARENRDPEFVRGQVAEGQTVVPADCNHDLLDPTVIGREFATKVNTNIDNSEATSDLTEGLEKLHAAVCYGADTMMDLSTGSNLDETRETNVAYSLVLIGTVPIYEAVKRVDNPEGIARSLLLDIIERQAEQSVGYIAIHTGVLMEHLPFTDGRRTGIVSRGSSILAQWMKEHSEQSPLYAAFEDICDIFAEHNMTLSLGDGLRPGCLVDAGDDARLIELDTLGGLTRTAWDHGVRVMVEGPGHVPMGQIAENVEHQRKACDGAPFCVLGPLVIDVAPGYDHITNAIGATEAGRADAAMLCYVTSKEHLGFPDHEDVRKGLAAYRIVAHAVDVANDLPGARDWDDALSEAHYEFDWARQFDLALDPERARSYHDQTLPGDNYKEACFYSMCGVEFYSMCINQDTRETDGEMEAIGSAINLDTSPAVDTNLPPVGVHDTDRVPDEIEIGGVTFTSESAHDDN